MKDINRERRVLLNALRHVLQQKDDQGIHDVIDQIKHREPDLGRSIKEDVCVEVSAVLGKSEINAGPWVEVMGGCGEKEVL